MRKFILSIICLAIPLCGFASYTEETLADDKIYGDEYGQQRVKIKILCDLIRKSKDRKERQCSKTQLKVEITYLLDDLDYQVKHWHGKTTDDWLQKLAYLKSDMKKLLDWVESR